MYLARLGSNSFFACNFSMQIRFWLLWSREAEASVARAYLSAGGPPLLNLSSLCGSRPTFHLYYCDWVVGVTIVFIVLIVLMSLTPLISGFFINSSLAPVLRFRRIYVSVRNVPKGIKLHGFSETRVAALWHRWHAVVRMGPIGPVTSFEPWTHCIPPDLHGFYKWAMDTSALLNEFILKVVRHRQTSRLQAWSNWIREDLTSRPYQVASA